MNFRNFGIPLIAISSCVIAVPAWAATSSGTMAVTATTLNACAIAPSALAFGTVSQISGSNIDGQTTMILTCTPGATYQVGMDQGTHASGGVRRMQSALGTEYLPYKIYTNASRTTEWGSTNGTNTVDGTGTALPITLNVYGRIAGTATPVSAGAYTDTVTVTVTF